MVSGKDTRQTVTKHLRTPASWSIGVLVGYLRRYAPSIDRNPTDIPLFCPEEEAQAHAFGSELHSGLPRPRAAPRRLRSVHAI